MSKERSDAFESLKELEALIRKAKKKDVNSDDLRDLNDQAFTASAFAIQAGISATCKESRLVAFKYGDPKGYEDHKDKCLIHPSVRLMTLAAESMDIVWNSHSDKTAMGIIASMLANMRAPFDAIREALDLAENMVKECDEIEAKNESGEVH